LFKTIVPFLGKPCRGADVKPPQGLKLRAGIIESRPVLRLLFRGEELPRVQKEDNEGRHHHNHPHPKDRQ